MPTRNTKFYSLVLILGDFFVLLAAFTVAYIARVQIDNRPLLPGVEAPGAMDFIYTVLGILPFWIIIFAFLGLYSAAVYNRRLLEWSRIGVGVFIGILLLIGWEYVTEQRLFPARLIVVYGFIGSFLLVLLEREFLRLVRSLMFRFGRGISRVLIIGNSPATIDIARSLSNTARSGYHIVAMAGPKRLATIESGVKHYSSLTQALSQIEPLRITTIIQTDLYDSEQRNHSILAAAQTHHIQYNFIPGEPEFYAGKNTIDIFLGYPLITVHQTPLVGWGEIFKRFFDLALVLLTFPIWGLVFVIIAIMQKLFNRGPLFFMDQRLGKFGQPLAVYKFRSMIPEYCGVAEEVFADMGRPDLVEEYTKNRKVKNDPRVTWFGNILRVTSLDELAQLINVLEGSMSLVGPRPILPNEKKLYRDRSPLLFSVKPGITGLWQVSGRSDLSFEKRVDLELYYAQNWSFWLDIKILFKTVGAVIRKAGAR